MHVKHETGGSIANTALRVTTEGSLAADAPPVPSVGKGAAPDLDLKTLPENGQGE